MDNGFFWGGLAILAVLFVGAALVRRKMTNRKRGDPSDIYPMW